MKRKFTFLMAAFTLLTMMASTGVSWATDVTFSYADYKGQGTQSSGSEYTMVKTDVSITNTKFYCGSTSTYAQFYAGGVSTITPSNGVTITKIVLTATATGYNGYQSGGTITASTGSISGSSSSTTVTWTGSASAAFTISNNKQIRWTSIVVTYTTSGGTPTVNTPTFSPAEGTYTEAQSVEISCTTEGATIYYTLDGNDPTTSSTVYSSAITINETTTVKAMAAKDNMNNSSVASATYTINLPYSGDDYVRINSLNDLTDGARVIIAARYNETGTAYYAMSNTASGKPTGVAFTSTASTFGEALPASILNLENSYYWTVNVTTDGYTFTNANNEVLGYSTGTNFATGGDYTVWTISRSTSGNAAMVVGYEAFTITNKNQDTRGIALNNQHNYGPYATSNNNSSSYNFYLDFFVQGAEPVITPSITISNVEEIAYDATSGSFDFTLNNPVSGGELSVTDNVDWISEAAIDGNATDGYSVSFATTVNAAATAREGIITLTYTYNTNQTVTKNVTITQTGNPNVFDDIVDITGTGDYRVKGMVVATSSKGFIIGDGTGYVYTYLNAAPSYGIGVDLSISGTTSTNYGHVIQFTNAATIETVEETNYNGDPQPTVITEVLDYSEGNHLSTYLEFEGTLNKSGSNYEVKIGESKIRISYPTNDQVTELTALLNKTVRVHGFFTGISGTNGSSVFTAMMESVEDLTPVTPVINADNVTLLYDATSGEIAYTISNPVTGVALEATTDAEWIDNITVGEASVTFTCSANEGTEDRTASFTLTYEGAENKVVNVTQGHYVVDFAVLPFEWAGGVKNDLLALNGVTANGLGSDYGDNNAPYRVKFDTEGDYIQVKTNEQPGIVTVGVKMIGGATTSKIVVQGSSDGVDFNNAIDTLVVSGKQNDTLVLETTHDFASTDRYVRLYFIKGSNVGVGPISIAQFDNTPSISASDVEIEYDVTSGAIVYTINRPVEGGVLTASVPDGSWVTLGTIGETVPFTCTANTAYTARTAIVTLTYTYGEESVTKDVTVTQGAAPEPLITLAPNMVNVGAEGGLCGFAVSLENIPASVNSGISVLFYPGLVEWIPDNGISYHNFNLNLMQMDSLYLTVLPNTTTESRSVDIKLVINGVQSNLVTIVQAAPFAPAFYTLATTIESGKQYIIVGLEGEKAYAMGEQKNNNRGGVIISKDGDTATVTRDAVYEFVITSSGENYTIYDARTPGYLCAASSNNNYLRTQVENDANGIWAIEIDQESGLATVEAQGSFTRRKMRFNYNGGNALFSCYASSSTAGTQVYFYVKDEVNTPSSYPLDIAGFGESEKGGYRLIASPINNLNPTAEGMTAGIYDLYAFDQSKESEWINYKAGAFNLISGKGYLYASKVDTTLSFIGSPYNGDGAVTLVYIDGAQFAGWNLIGNPFATAATLDKPYYRLNSDGSSLNTFTENTSVACMEGVFVKATEAGQTATFTAQTSKGEKKGIALLNLMVSGNRGMVNDNAIIRFDNGQTLEKFVLRKNGTKLYIVEGNKDYAIVLSNGQGEMPVNFKAETNGTYTISVNAENVNMSYLHLIDNVTGADVDLLATPSYSFEANTNDYATRFRLVFKANANVPENADADTFAFFNGNEWVVSNIGEATLQVVDVMGRVLRSETINGNAEISIKQEPGVYMLRLINGDNVKTQKVVVR